MSGDPVLLAAATRWAGFLGALLVTGAVVFRFSVLPGFHRNGGGALPGALERAAAVGLAAALLLALAAPVRLYAQALGFIEPGESVTRELLGTILRETARGRGWVLQFLAAGLAVTAFVAARGLPAPGGSRPGVLADRARRRRHRRRGRRRPGLPLPRGIDHGALDHRLWPDAPAQADRAGHDSWPWARGTGG